jgi:GPH family glycoside/pentoside/hexuronide:cation symporter
LARALAAALGLGGVGAGLVAGGAHGLGWPAILVGAAGFGVGVGGAQITGLAALAEAIRRFNQASGQRQEGLMTGLWTAAERIAYALGPAVASVTLSLGGFVAGAARGALSAGALEAGRLSMTVGPVALFALAAAACLLSPAYGQLSAPQAAA